MKPRRENGAGVVSPMTSDVRSGFVLIGVFPPAIGQANSTKSGANANHQSARRRHERYGRGLAAVFGIRPSLIGGSTAVATVRCAHGRGNGEGQKPAGRRGSAILRAQGNVAEKDGGKETRPPTQYTVNDLASPGIEIGSRLPVE